MSKLKDRGTHQAFGVVTNAQDFMHILRLFVERELGGRSADPRVHPPGGCTRDDRDSAAVSRERSRSACRSEQVVEVHLFPPIRQGGVETGVAVVAEDPESMHRRACR